MLSAINGFFLPFRGLRLILRPGVRRFVVIPVLLNIVVFVGLAWFAGSYFEHFMAHYLPENTWWSFLRPLLWVLFAAAYLLAVFYGFTILANLIASPFNDILAARIEQMLTGRMPPEAETGLIASIPGAIGGELVKLGYLLKWTLPLLILFLLATFIPGLNVIATGLWVAFGFWFLALEYADYPMGNHQIEPKAQRQRLGRRRLKSLSFGAGVSLLMLVLGFLAMPAAVAAATLYWLEDISTGD